MAEQQLTRRRVPPAARVGPAPCRTLTCVSPRPRVYVQDGFVTADEAAALAALGAASVVQAHGLHTKADSTGFSFELPDAVDPLVAEVRQRIERTLGVPNECGGTLRYRRYEAGHAHPPHHDHYEMAGRWLLATAMICLTDVEAGGETRFPQAWPPLEVLPRRGRLVLWLDHAADGRPDRSSLHDGAPVLQGTKTTVTEFVYGDPGSSSLLRLGPAAAGS
jgi:prolyl 4-hydroxylase